MSDAVLTELADRQPRDGATREQVVRHGEIRRLALSVRDGGRALKDNRIGLQQIVADMAPGLTERRGIGPVTAAQVIVSFSHVGRCGEDGEEDAVGPQDLQEETMTGFIQIIEMQTSRIDEVEALIRELRNRLDDGGSSAPRRGTLTADRDRDGFYLSIVEFDSFEAAMENSNRPEVGEYAARMAKLCDAPPRFYNLEVRETWQPSNR